MVLGDFFVNARLKLKKSSISRFLYISRYVDGVYMRIFFICRDYDLMASGVLNTL